MIDYHIVTADVSCQQKLKKIDPLEMIIDKIKIMLTK
jgi:hypothetical protein